MSRKIRSSQLSASALRGAPAQGRMRRNDSRFISDVRRVATLKRIVAIVATLLVVAVVAVVAWWFAFTSSVTGKLSLGDSTAASSLVAVESGEPYYALLAADLDSSSSSDDFVPDALILARVDETSSTVTLVSVPANLRVRLSDGERHPLSDAVSIGGEAELVSAVASFAEVDISHYVKIDAAGISSLVDALGGVTVEVPESVDDPSAGSAYIRSGTQTLSGSEALVLLRASNYEDGTQTQAEAQLAFVAALAQQLAETDGLAFLFRLDGLANFVSTDIDAGTAMGIASALHGLEASQVFTARVPGSETTSDEVVYYVADSSSWADMMDLVEAGEDPSANDEAAAVASVDPASFEITVRNGSGITGGAAEIAASLENAGFQVVETGNADSYVYEETLVVYQDDDYADEAAAVVKALGMGRAVASAGYYTFDTEILVVLGSDWKPTS